MKDRALRRTLQDSGMIGVGTWDNDPYLKISIAVIKRDLRALLKHLKLEVVETAPGVIVRKRSKKIEVVRQNYGL